METYHKVYTTVKMRPLLEDIEAKRENLSSYVFHRLVRAHLATSLLFTAFIIAVVAWRFFQSRLAAFPKFAVALVFIALEAARAKMGLEGNRTESFPELSAFILLSFPSLALLALLLLTPLIPLYEIVYCSVHTAFILVEIVAAVCLLGRFSRGKLRLLRACKAL